MRPAFRRAVLPALALSLAAGCEEIGTGVAVCPDIVVPSLSVQVVDASTGASLNRGAGGWWVAGADAGLLRNDDPTGQADLVAYGPAGRYSLVVQHPGYATWGRDDLRVASGRCGPRTLRVRVELVPDGGVRAAEGT